MSEYPSDWQVVKLADIAAISASNVDKKVREGQKPVHLCNYMDVFQNSAITKNLHFMESTASEKEIRDFSLFKGDVLLTKDSEIPEEIGVTSVVKDDITDLICGYHLYILQPRKSQIDPEYLCWSLRNASVRKYFYQMANGSTRFGLNAKHVEECPIALPPLPEQKKIAEILSGIDKIIARYSQKREKLSKLRSALRSDLLSGRKGSWGMSEHPSEWHMSTLGESCDIHDSKRIPLSSKQRQTRKGEYPYYGANNIQDYIDAYLFDFDSVLLAEDGGYYDEYQSRPIAQFATGKYWVNNHAHILTGKIEMDIRFLFYSLIHKNILQYINTGTRSKLNQSELKQIEILVPPLSEQKKIAEILSGVDHQMATLLDAEKKYVSLKQAIAADLLSGRKRVSV